MHVGIVNTRWQGKRSRHSRWMRNPNVTYLVRGPRLLMPSPLCHLQIWHWVGRIPWPLFPQQSFSTISVLAVFIKNTVTLKYILNIIYMLNIWSDEVKVAYRASQHPFNELNKSLSIQYIRPFKLATTFFLIHQVVLITFYFEVAIALVKNKSQHHKIRNIEIRILSITPREIRTQHFSRALRCHESVAIWSFWFLFNFFNWLFKLTTTRSSNIAVSIPLWKESTSDWPGNEPPMQKSFHVIRSWYPSTMLSV